MALCPRRAPSASFQANFVRRDLVQNRDTPFNFSNIEDDTRDLQELWGARPDVWSNFMQFAYGVKNR